ncbi:CLUMA_CG018344, isoform A [Clunio marinus]|uniref:CLUMA_CG018344, isoform A n=1 Tax=Clunio marinus TaxID=568069 RepID=A0A1J1J004_9DIPT|nr:CLUMA_CG018344, isoform A [Clunio marinus]
MARLFCFTHAVIDDNKDEIFSKAVFLFSNLKFEIEIKFWAQFTLGCRDLYNNFQCLEMLKRVSKPTNQRKSEYCLTLPQEKRNQKEKKIMQSVEVRKSQLDSKAYL